MIFMISFIVLVENIPGGPKKVSIFDPYYNGIRVKY
jgi:hypothetical protein